MTRARRMPRKRLILLMDQLEMYVRAGLPVDQALESMRGGFGSKHAERLSRVSGSIQSGRTLSAALSHEFALPGAVLGLIGSGESSGTLVDALGACRIMLERQDELIKKSVSALLYPCVIGVATIGLTIGLMEGVMPQIIPLLAGLHARLPVITQVVIWISRSITAYWAWMCLICAGLASISALLYRKNGHARRAAHGLILRVPVLGELVAQHSLALFFESLGSMISIGIPIDEAFGQALDSIGVIPIRDKFRQKSDPLMRGGPSSSIADAQIRGMPRYAASLLVAGEASGSLGACMRRIAAMIDKELEHALKRLTSLLEPVMMIAMGGMVGSIALSIMMPIYDISRALQK